MLANMKSELLQRIREEFDDGSVMELVIWRVPMMVQGSSHTFKYRLFYGRHGKRIVGYDNERPKGDHRHIAGKEFPYRFTTVDNLLRDFLADVAEQRAS